MPLLWFGKAIPARRVRAKGSASQLAGELDGVAGIRAIEVNT